MNVITLADFDESAWSVGRAYLSAGSWPHGGTTRHSIYRHPLGIVEIDEYTAGKPITAIRFTHAGVQHMRRWPTT